MDGVILRVNASQEGEGGGGGGGAVGREEKRLAGV